MKRVLLAIGCWLLLNGFLILQTPPAFAIVDESLAPQTRPEFVPNEVIVKYKEGQSPHDLAQKVQERIKKGTTALGLLQNIREDLVSRIRGQETPEEAAESLRNLEARVKTVKREPVFKLGGKQKVLGAKVPQKSSTFDNYFLYETSPQVGTLEAVQKFSQDPRVEFAEPNYILKLMDEPNDPYYAQGAMWGLEKIQMDAAWDINKGSENIVVAVIDSGVDYEHEDFQGGNVEIIKGPNYWPGGCGLSEDDPMDQLGHGTHVAGTIGAATNNNLGVAGINWNIKIMAIKIGCKTRAVYTAGGAAGIVYAADNGAKVINMSWGDEVLNDGPTFSYTLHEAVKYAYDEGVVLVGAAGNRGRGGAICPACYDEVIAVAATNSNDQRASFSNYGSGVDLAAPGVNIISLMSDENYICGASKYCYLGGTSMATPHVAGLAALILAHNPGLSPDQVKQILIETGDDIGNQRIGPRINAYKALIGTAPGPSPTPTPTGSPEPTPTPTPTPTPSPGATPTPSPGVSPSPTPTPTGSPTPTPTLTPTPTPGPVTSLTLTVKLQGISSYKKERDMRLKITPGDISRFVRFYSDEIGHFTGVIDLSDVNLRSGQYSISVKEPHHLTKNFSVSLAAGDNLISRTTPQDELKAGDVDGDDDVDETDKDLLVSAYSPFSVVGAVEDLNENGYVNSLDYSLLLTNLPGAPPTPTPTPTATPTPTPTATPTLTPTPTPSPRDQFRSFLIIFNPIIESQGNKKLTDLMGWNDPDQLTHQYIQDLKAVSGGFANYVIEERLEIDDIPQKLDGFDYTDETYLICLEDHSLCHEPDMVDYGKIFQDYDICNKVQATDISEVWIFGGPWFGGYEWIVKGPNIDLNSVNVPNCGKTIITFFFNYERGVAEMLEDFGHLTEGMMYYVLDVNSDPDNEWDKFDGQRHRYSYSYDCDNQPPLDTENAHCGNVHFSPNSRCHYEHWHQEKVWSDCDDWYNYPNLTGTKKQIDCTAWGCEDMRDHHVWWLRHLPRAEGKTNGKLNNWWRYIVDFDNT